MTDEPTNEARSNVLQFQTAEARWRIEYRRNKAAFVQLARKILRAREEETSKMESAWLSKGRLIADTSVELRERGERLGMYEASQEGEKESQ